MILKYISLWTHCIYQNSNAWNGPARIKNSIWTAIAETFWLSLIWIDRSTTNEEYKTQAFESLQNR